LTVRLLTSFFGHGRPASFFSLCSFAFFFHLTPFPGKIRPPDPLPKTLFRFSSSGPSVLRSFFSFSFFNALRRFYPLSPFRRPNSNTRCTCLLLFLGLRPLPLFQHYWCVWKTYVGWPGTVRPLINAPLFFRWPLFSAPLLPLLVFSLFFSERPDSTFSVQVIPPTPIFLTLLFFSFSRFSFFWEHFTARPACS